MNWRNQECIHKEETIKEKEGQHNLLEEDKSKAPVALKHVPVPHGFFAKAAKPVVSADSHFVNKVHS